MTKDNELRSLLEEYVNLGWGEPCVSKELYKAAKEALPGLTHLELLTL